MKNSKKLFSEIEHFLIENANAIQKLATKHHKEFLDGEKFRTEVIEKYQENHRNLVKELAKHLEQKHLKKGLAVFKKLGETLAKDAVRDDLHIEEAVDGTIFIKQAIWQRLDEEGLLKKLSSKEFYQISQAIGTYSDVVASKIAFAYHKAHTEKVAKDLAERKKAEQTIIDERKFAQDIVETIREPLIVLDTKLRVVSANSSFYTTFKVAPQATEGKLIYNLGNGQWNIPELRKLLNDILPKKKQLNNYEVKHVFPSIGQKTMLLNARSIDHVQLVLLAIEDVTERTEAAEKVRNTEKRYKTLIEKSTDVITLSDNQGNYSFVTPSIKRVLGYSPEEFTKKSGFEMMHPDEIPSISEKFQELLATPGKSLTIEIRGRHKNTSWRWIEATATNLLHDPSVNAIVSNFRDITDRKNLERQKDEFMGIVSHELKTPVTSLKAFAQVLQNRFAKAGDDKSVVHLGKMDAQINKLTALIADLLDVTKIEGGRLQFHNDYFKFDEIVSEVVEELQRTTNKHKIEKVGKAKKTIRGDKERLGQVITNLLTNAIKYSPHSDKIIVKTISDRANVTLCVQDFGIGIPKEKQSRIFERFYRETGTQDITYPGLGLGLYIAKEIITRQGGTIWVESKKNKGSTFCFALPIDGSTAKKHQLNTLVEEEIKHE